MVYLPTLIFRVNVGRYPYIECLGIVDLVVTLEIYHPFPLNHRAMGQKIVGGIL